MKSALTIEDISLEIASGIACALSQVVSDGVLHLRPFSVTDDGRLSIADAPRIPQSAVPANKMRFEAGDILFNNTNSVELVGKSAVFSTVLDASFSNHMTRIRVNRRHAEPGYVHAYLRHLYRRRFFQDRATRWVSQAAFGTAQLKALEVPLPPLEEQRRIVGLLDRAAEIRRSTDAARSRARAIIPALFLDTFGDPATNPKGWPETQLSEVIATTLSYGSMTSPRASDDEWLDIRVANIKGNQIDHSDKKYVTLEPSLAAKHSLADGDIVLARAIGSESHLGKCAVVYPGKERWAYDSHIMRIRVDQNRISPVWLHTLMNTDGGKARLLRQKRASAIQHNINTKEVAIFRFSLPPLPLQTAFAEQAQRLEALARALDTACAKAIAMAAGLSAEVFG